MKKIYLLFVFCLLLFPGIKVLAQSLSIVEIMPNPNGTDTKSNEYIKLKNFSDSTVSLENWKLCNINNDCYFLSGEIPPNECLTILREKFIFVLHNDIEKISLIDPTRSLINELSIVNSPSEKAWTCVGTNCSWQDPKSTCDYTENPNSNSGQNNQENSPEQNTLTDSNNNSNINSQPNKTFVLNEKVESNYYKKLIISEIYPNPESNNEEWIELYNNSDETIYLNGWYLDDQEGESSPFHIPSSYELKPFDYLVLQKSQTKINLNNIGDNVRLFDSWGKLVDKVIYPNSTKGSSYSLFDSEWKWTGKPSPATNNTFEEIISGSNSSTKVIDIKNQKDLERAKEKLGKKESMYINIEGEIKISLGIIEDNIFYFNSNDTLFKGQTYSSFQGNKKTLENKNKVQILKAKLSNANGFLKLSLDKNTEITKLDSNFRKEVFAFSPKDINHFEGKTVRIKGKILRKSGNYLFIKPDNSELTIPSYFPSSLQNKPNNTFPTYNSVKTNYKDAIIEAEAVVERNGKEFRLIVEKVYKLDLANKKPSKSKKTSSKKLSTSALPATNSKPAIFIYNPISRNFDRIKNQIEEKISFNNLLESSFDRMTNLISHFLKT